MFSFMKKKENSPRAPSNVPVVEVRHLTELGMSDKDVIRRLKEQGYSFGEIEKAMMNAVKGGVNESAEAPLQMEPNIEYAPREPQNQEQNYTTNDQQDVFSNYNNNNEEVPTLGELNNDEGEMAVPGFQEGIAPDVAIEELVEGVVDEKWGDFSSRMERQDSVISELRTEIRLLQNKIERLSNKPNESEEVSDKVNQQLEDLDVRINSLEKAFKQMLPSLTKNIQELTFIAKQKNDNELAKFE